MFSRCPAIPTVVKARIYARPNWQAALNVDFYYANENTSTKLTFFTRYIQFRRCLQNTKARIHTTGTYSLKSVATRNERMRKFYDRTTSSNGKAVIQRIQHLTENRDTGAKRIYISRLDIKLFHDVAKSHGKKISHPNLIFVFFGIKVALERGPAQ